MAGLDDAKLLETRVRMETMWGDAQMRKNYTAKADTLNAILNKQTARATILTDGQKDYDLSVNWFRLADQTVTTFDPAVGTDICTITGPELEAGKQSYNLTQGVSKSFEIVDTGSANGAGLRGLDANLQEMAAQGMLQARKAIVEHLNKSTIAKVDTFSGANKYTGGYTTVDSDTSIPAAQFNARTLLPYLARVQMMNEYVDPYILDGGLLWDDLFIANVGATGTDQVKLQSLFGQFDITEDMWGFAQAAVADRAYLVDRNAVAFFSKNHFAYTGGVIDRGNNRKDYAIALPELGNNVYADVAYEYRCEGATNTWVHAWKLMVRYDVLLNPVIGDADLTGVLAFRKAAAV